MKPNERMKRQKIYAVVDGENDANSLTKLCHDLLTEQVESWGDLRKAYESLKNIKVKNVPCNGFSVLIQHNPGRVKSSTADVDDAHINSRPCFLCLKNLPEAQQGILYHNTYLILCNPAPVFPSHLTVSHLEHRPQAILDSIDSFLLLTADFGIGWTVLYNGPKCGASAPDHMHFQAIPSGLMPIEKEYKDKKRLIRVKKIDGVMISRLKDSGREIIMLEGDNRANVASALFNIINALKGVLQINTEPLLNVVGQHDERQWRIFLFPRSKHRPDAFYKTGKERILVSPAVIEMGGVVITPVERDFEKLGAFDVKRIYEEVSLGKDLADKVFEELLLSRAE